MYSAKKRQKTIKSNGINVSPRFSVRSTPKREGITPKRWKEDGEANAKIRVHEM
jgi:hypothetical protein